MKAAIQLAAMLLFWLCCAGPWNNFGSGRTVPNFDEQRQKYENTPATDALAHLGQDGSELKFDSKLGYLPDLLNRLDVPAPSQLLVASKTSPNKNYISPKNPRAIYYNDSVYIAYVPGAPILEMAATDPNLGLVFYTLDQKPKARPVRDNRCLECHASAKTLDVPGLLVRSFVTSQDGDVDLLSGLMVNHRTPIAERWGGYYVTGCPPELKHRGNGFVEGTGKEGVIDLRKQLDLTKYPAKSSDILPLMVLEHQGYIHNLLTRIAYQARRELELNHEISAVYPEIEAALRYMFFVEEAPLPCPIPEAAEFSRGFVFRSSGTGDCKNLREFDLKKKLFARSCSYMIYAPVFNSLPGEAKKHFYRRLWQILSNEDPGFQSISKEERLEIQKILITTKPDLPEYWRL